MAVSNFTFRLSSEGGQQVINDLKGLATSSAEAERALRTLTQASPQLASVADGVQAKIAQVATQMRDQATAANQAALSQSKLSDSIAADTPALSAFLQQGKEMVDVARTTGTVWEVAGKAVSAALRLIT